MAGMGLTGWKAGWADRTLPAFQSYSLAANCILVFAISVNSFICILNARRCAKQLKDAASVSDKAAIGRDLRKHVHKTCRANHYIALLYLLNFIAIWSVDSYVSMADVSNVVSEHRDEITWEFYIVLALYAMYFLAIFSAAFVLVPAAQMMIATRILTRIARRRGSLALSEYVPEARMYSTQMAQVWTMTSFLLATCWPMFDYSATRFVVLLACLGSSTAWLDVSYAFVFCSDKLDQIELGDARVASVVKMFATTAKAVHIGQKGNSNDLPRHHDVSQSRPVDEKTELLVETRTEQVSNEL